MLLRDAGRDALGDDPAGGALAEMEFISVPLSTCWWPFEIAIEELAASELSPRRMQLGYFQVMAEPVSTWVHEIFELLLAASPRLVTKL